MADIRIPLSKIARDPVVVAFFKRGEGDNSQFTVVPASPKPAPNGDEANVTECA